MGIERSVQEAQHCTTCPDGCQKKNAAKRHLKGKKYTSVLVTFRA